MKKAILMMAMIAGSTAAYADGFVCENLDQNIRVKAFNKVNPKNGTRNSSVLVLADPSVSAGRKTIARFSADNALLTNDSATYTALVDLRFNDSNLKGRNLLGTKLGHVKYIVLDVDFTFSRPVPGGTEMSGELILKRRNGGEDIRVDVTCVRYLKG